MNNQDYQLIMETLQELAEFQEPVNFEEEPEVFDFSNYSELFEGRE